MSQDRIVGGSLLLVAAVVAAAAWNLPETGVAETMGPKAYPLALTVILAGLSLALMTVKPTGGGGTLSKAMLLRGFLPTVSFLVLYLALMPALGFAISTIALLLTLFWLKGERRWALNLAAAVGSTLGIYLLFGYLLHVPLRLFPVSW